MATKQGSLELLEHPVAQELLASTIPARVANLWLDGTPRVTPIWFHWNGSELVLATHSQLPKVRAMSRNPDVAVTIDDVTPPYKSLLIRGKVAVTIQDGMAQEFAANAERYYGVENALPFLEEQRRITQQQALVRITPTWVGVIDFVDRLPQNLKSD